MPVVAESPPLIFGGTPAPTPTPTPKPVYTPKPTTPSPTPAPYYTPTPTPIGTSSFVVRHEQFINRVDGLNACFMRTELSDFTDQEFLDHSAVAMMDKYITQEKDIYCSMKGVQTLTKALKRLGEE